MVEKKEVTIALPGVDLPAIITLARAGQTPPDEGDNVRVRWQLMLPAFRDRYLHDSCRFANRLEPVCGYILSSFWGREVEDRPGYVARDGYFAARKWAEAFELAERHVLGELQKLLDALKARKRALEEAEE